MKKEDITYHFIKLAGNQSTYQVLMCITLFVFSLAISTLDFGLSFFEDVRTIDYYDTETNTTVYGEQWDYESTCETKEENDWVEGVDYNVTDTPRHSIAVTLDIECDYAKVALIGTMVSIGYIVGGLVYGYLIKPLGYKLFIIINIVLTIVCLVLMIFIKNFGFHVFVFLFVSITCINFLDPSTEYIQEVNSMKITSIVQGIYNSGYCLGGIIFSLILMGIKDWRYAVGIEAGILLVALIVFIFIGTDFFYVLVEDKNKDKMLRYLKLIATINGRKKEFLAEMEKPENQLKWKQLFDEASMDEIPQIAENEQVQVQVKPKDSEIVVFKDEDNKEKPVQPSQEKPVQPSQEKPVQPSQEKTVQPNQEEPEPVKPNQDKPNIEETKKEDNSQVAQKEDESAIPDGTLLDIFIYPSVRYPFLIYSLLFFVDNFVYCGITIGVKNLPGDIYVNNILMNLVELPSYYLAGWTMIMPKLGRKYSLVLWSVFYTVMCLFLFIFEKHDTAALVLYLLARFGVSGNYVVLIPFAMEGYPKNISLVAYGLNEILYGLGGIAVSFVTEATSTRITYLLFFVVSVPSIVFMFFLDETFNKIQNVQIPEIAEREKLAKKQKEANANGENLQSNENLKKGEQGNEPKVVAVQANA